MSELNPAAVEAGARAMHARFEQRAERRAPFYTRMPWDRLSEDERGEFEDYAVAVLRGVQTVDADPDDAGVDCA